MSQSPRDPGPPNHINYYMLGIGGHDYHFGELDLFVYNCKCKRNCTSQRSRAKRGKQNHINYYIFWIVCQDYNLKEWNLFVHHWRYQSNCICQKPRDPGPPKPHYFLYFYDWWAKLSFGRIELVCLPMEMQKKLHIPRVPGPGAPGCTKSHGTPGPLNHINCYFLWIGDKNYNLGKLNLLVHHLTY